MQGRTLSPFHESAHNSTVTMREGTAVHKTAAAEDLAAIEAITAVVEPAVAVGKAVAAVVAAVAPLFRTSLEEDQTADTLDDTHQIGEK